MKAHFIGMGGTGMSAVAKLLQDSGWQVSGSDEAVYPPISDYLIQHRLHCFEGYDASHIQADLDLIVIGKHAGLVPESNPEVAAAFESGKQIKSFPQVLEMLTEKRKRFVVAGSFGKSTNSILMAFLLSQANLDPGFFLGAVSTSLPSNAQLGNGDLFVLEGDEYPAANWDSSPKFKYYHPDSVLLISGEHDHINVYPTLDDYLKPFIELLQAMPIEGKIIACANGENIESILEKAGRKAVTYGLEAPNAQWKAHILNTGTVTRFEVHNGKEKIGEFETALIGKHNIENCLGVITFILEHGLMKVEQIKEALPRFAGVKRRLELKNPGSIVPLYEDFGSSRAKALAGIKSIREVYSEHYLTILFEPHTFSFRNRGALSWYDDLFKAANLVLVFPPPGHGAASHDQLSQIEIVERIQSSGTAAVAVQDKESTFQAIKAIETKLPQVFLIESSGDLLGVIPSLVDYFSGIS